MPTMAGLRAALAPLLPQSKSRVARCDDKYEPHAPDYPFWFKGWFGSYDMGGIRRGFEVYTQVCSACHSMEEMQYGDMVNTVYPEKHMKMLAAQQEYMSKEPNDQGKYFMKPGGLLDFLPSPYPNEEAARFANGGAMPPDLSNWSLASHGGVDYIFAILTSYHDPPYGIELRSGLYYNPYFAGGAISMPPPLVEDGQIEYHDGTPATRGQMAKDVCQWITWSGERFHDEQRMNGLKAGSAFFICTFFCCYYKRAIMVAHHHARHDFTRVRR